MATRTVLGASHCIILVPFLLVTGAASALPAPAGAAPQGARPPIYAFSDSRTLPTEATLLAKLPGARSLLCAPGGPAPLTTLALDQAIATIHAYLSRTYGAKALAALDQGTPAGNADQAEHVAAGAVLANAPGAALEAALRAHQDAPTDPRPLINAAALLPNLGLANEALALLDAADRLPMPKGGAPLGIPLPAVSLTNRGYALLALRRWQQAEAPLQEASRLSSDLPEADLNLGEALLCAGDDAPSTRYFIAGGRRDTFRPDVVEEGGDPAAPTRTVSADAVFDLSAGVKRQSPEITYPPTPQKALAMGPFISQLIASRETSMIAQRTQQNALVRRLPPNLNAATMQRTQDILHAILFANQAHAIRDLSRGINADVLNADHISSTYWTWAQGVSFQICAGRLPSAYQQWLTAMTLLDRDERRWWAAYTKRTTGLAANLANPSYHALAESYIAGATEAAYVGLLSTLNNWISSEAAFRGCVGKPWANPDLGTWPALQQTPPAAECGPGIRAPHNAILTLPPPFDHITLKANCESASVQVESPEPGIKGFISIGRDLRTGETTTVIGPKAGVSIPGTGISGGFETGIYVTTDSNGIKDWGLSANLTGSTPISPNGLAAFEANAPVTVSLIGSIDYIPTAFGFSH